jgi:hypothetical protein
VIQRLAAAGVRRRRSRGDNGAPAPPQHQHQRNITQQDYFADVTTRSCCRSSKPATILHSRFWSRPDGTQHNQGDSLNQLRPASMARPPLASIKNADGTCVAFGRLLPTRPCRYDRHIRDRHHGFSTIKEVATASPHERLYADVPAGLPPGFRDRHRDGAGPTLHDPDAKNALIAANSHPSRVTD